MKSENLVKNNQEDVQTKATEMKIAEKCMEYVSLHKEALEEIYYINMGMSIDEDYWRKLIEELLAEEFSYFVSDPEDEQKLEFFLQNPYSSFYVYEGVYIFGYIPSLRKVWCLNDTFVAIPDIEEHQVPKAIHHLILRHRSEGFFDVSIEC